MDYGCMCDPLKIPVLWICFYIIFICNCVGEYFIRMLVNKWNMQNVDWTDEEKSFFFYLKKLFL